VAEGPFRFVAGVPGFLAFLLSLARTAWLGWAIGAVFLLVRARGIQKMRLLAAGLLLCLFSLPLLSLGAGVETITGRLESLQQIEGDYSYRARLGSYANLALRSMADIVGDGIGATNLATKLTNDERKDTSVVTDSGILELPFTLGWPGSMLYLGGLGWLLSLVFSGCAQRKDIAAQAAAAIVLATLAQMLSYNSLIGVSGMVFWNFLGLALAANASHRHQPSDAVCKR
jgi:hypothetical protein